TVYGRSRAKSTLASRQSVGTDDGVSGIRCAKPSGERLAVRVMNRIDHEPQQLELEGEGLERAALRLDGRTPRLDKMEPLLAVARSLDQAALEIVERFRANPAVVLRKGRNPLAHQVRREELREGRCDAVDRRFGLAERPVRLGRKP